MATVVAEVTPEPVSAVVLTVETANPEAGTEELPAEEEESMAIAEETPKPTEEPMELWTSFPTYNDNGEVGVLFAATGLYYLDFSEDMLFLEADFDGDGSKEKIYGGLIDTETDCLRFYVGNKGEETEIYCVTNMAIARLAEGETPRLLICGDFGSDDYMTYVFSVSQSALTCEDMIEARLATEGTDLYFCERYECLGTRDGVRAYAGNPLLPLSEVLIPSYIPTADEIAGDRKSLTSIGALLKSKVDISAKTEAGADAVIPAGTYLYLTAFTESLDQIWVKTEEGTTYVLETNLPNGGRVMTVNGLPEDMCFSYLSYAD